MSILFPSHAVDREAPGPQPRRLPIGAEPTPQGVHFRVWAPAVHRLCVVQAGRNGGGWRSTLHAEGNGYFSGLVPDAAAGMTYFLQLDDGETLWPDPASRFQPNGPRSASRIEDPHSFAWRDQTWPGVTLADQVIYEMHIGTFTTEGTWRAAARQLPELANLGVTLLEIMPIGDFPGSFGWGYDVANQFAPSRLYGTPDELRYFVDEAHRVGLGVLLDVVYNHFGQVGEQLLRPFSDDYFSQRHENEWGTAINFDGPRAAYVREFFLANVEHWISEYHFDGLRIDATQAFHDDSRQPILLAITRAARRAAGRRKVLIIGENEPQRASLLRPAHEQGCELDALWNDDFHHAAMVRLTGRREAYYTDYTGSASEFLAGVQWGFLYQGQRYSWQDKPRGTPALDIAAPRLINFLQNHDQIANSARGARIHQLTSPARYRAMTALLLLGPQTPLLFQGQEFAASSPFLYFNDSGPDETEKVARGRARFLQQFPSLASAEMQERLPDPAQPAIFSRSRLDFSERQRNAGIYAMHRDLLRLRREDPVLREHDARAIQGATLTDDALVLRYLPASGPTRLVIFNFGADLRLDFVAQPLMAPPERADWRVLWSSENPDYGGGGVTQLNSADGWRIPGESATVLEPVACSRA